MSMIKDMANLEAILNDEKRMTKLAAMMPPGTNMERFKYFVRTTVAENRKLLQCSEGSVLKAVADCASLGLMLSGPIGHAFLVPYKGVCKLIIGYKGRLEMIRRSGMVRSCHAQVVHENDEFRQQQGTDPKVEHTWDIRKPRGEICGVYAVAVKTSGDRIIEVMSKDDIERVRACSASSEGDAWNKWYGEMARGKVLNRISKFLDTNPVLAAVDDDFMPPAGDPVEANSGQRHTASDDPLDDVANQMMNGGASDEQPQYEDQNDSPI